MPKIVDHDLYRKKLLSKCLDLFALHGYGSITMRQIASGLKVSTGTLYHYFPSKESLFEQLVEYLSYEDTKEQILVELGNPLTLAEKIEAMMNFIAKNEGYFLKQIFILVDFCQRKDRQEIDRNKALQVASKRYEKALADYLNISDPEVVVFVLNCIDGLLLRRLFQGERISFTEQSNLLANMLSSYGKENLIEEKRNYESSVV